MKKKYHPTQYRLLLLNQTPYLHNATGATNPSVKLTNPRTEFPHPTPSTLYILGANSGKLNPAIVRTKAAAPVAEAA